MHWSMLMNSADSMVRGSAAIVEMAQTWQAVTGQCCKVHSVAKFVFNTKLLCDM
jgi:hypothetical protein